MGTTAVDIAQTYLDAAIRYQEQLSRITGGGSLLTRYWLVLEELRLEALKRTHGESTPPPINLTAEDTETMSIENINSILYAPIACPDIYGSFMSFQPSVNGVSASTGNLSAYLYPDWQP